MLVLVVRPEAKAVLADLVQQESQLVAGAELGETVPSLRSGLGQQAPSREELSCKCQG